MLTVRTVLFWTPFYALRLHFVTHELLRMAYAEN